MNILLEKARRMLEENIIPFWQGLRDDEYGGYVGHVDFSMHSDCKAEKGCILHSRILWFFSEAALLLNRMDLAADAEHVYSFFTQHCMCPVCVIFLLSPDQESECETAGVSVV